VILRKQSVNTVQATIHHSFFYKKFKHTFSSNYKLPICCLHISYQI